ncbi:hypothetical protein [Streptomyces sp. NPDC005573]|uniref:hypothetical protein n=1 Tax=Streptomyces sp. NPDC005573 TaxID=3156890 RepID=UPI0033A29562
MGLGNALVTVTVIDVDPWRRGPGAGGRGRGMGDGIVTRGPLFARVEAVNEALIRGE